MIGYILYCTFLGSELEPCHYRKHGIVGCLRPRREGRVEQEQENAASKRCNPPLSLILTKMSKTTKLNTSYNGICQPLPFPFTTLQPYEITSHEAMLIVQKANPPHPYFPTILNNGAILALLLKPTRYEILPRFNGLCLSGPFSVGFCGV